ncbi:neugrin [Dendropsophus ebraccatus]|uniref:neugrin n=1 Tax=Dendropsophus ebraccatus TaxID=150705 RepID=UPI0038318CDA
MAASLQTAMWRLRRLWASHCPVLGSRSIRTRSPVNHSPGEEQELESDDETVEAVEQDIRSALKRHQKVIQLKRMKKEMEPPEAPERRLTWNAIQQIRYLREEFPEEWPLSRLAVGFNVSTDVIKKVLRSKFIPSESRRIKQDAAASRVHGQNSSGSSNDQLQLGPPSKALITKEQPLLPLKGNQRQLLLSQSRQLLPPPPKASESSVLSVQTAFVTKSLARPQEPQGSVQGVFHAVSSQGLTTSVQEEADQTLNEGIDKTRHDEKWDGEVLSDKEMEELANTGVLCNMKVVQHGREFFDSDGNFLYRI